MDALEVFQQLQDALRDLEAARRRMYQFGKEKAKAEAEYRSAKAKAILAERLEGTPVTIIRDVIFDDRSLVEKKYLRDASETVYDSSHEEVLALKLKVNVLRDVMEQISRGS